MSVPEKPKWAKRREFAEAVTRLRTTEGLTLTEVAERFGIALSSLHSLLYGKKARPSIDLLQRVAETTGIPVANFIDQPLQATFSGSRPPSPGATFFAQLILADLSAADLSDEDLKALYDAWRWHLDQLRRIKSPR